MPCPSSANTAAHPALQSRGSARESRCSAIHPEIPLCGIEGPRPSLPGRQHFHSAVLAVILNPRKRVKDLSSIVCVAHGAPAHHSGSATTFNCQLSTVNSITHSRPLTSPNLILLHAPVLELPLLAPPPPLTTCKLRAASIRSNVRPCPALPRDGPPGIALRACKGEVGKWHPPRTQKCTIQTPRKTRRART